MEAMLRNATALIDLDAIVQNYGIVRAYAGDSAVVAVIKADAYGHGIGRVARALESAPVPPEYLAVATYSEAFAIRQAGVRSPILLMGYMPPERAALLIQHNITAEVYDEAYAAALSAAAVAAGGRVQAHIKADTGMSRVGLLCQSEGDLAAAADAAERIARLPGLDVQGIMTHFSTAESDDPTGVNRQYELFAALLAELGRRGIDPRWKHAVAAGTLVLHKDKLLNMVRVGIAFFGTGSEPDTVMPAGLVPTMTVRTRLVSVKRVAAGAGVSYGRTFIAPRDMTLGVVTFGYADGYPRSCSNRAYMLVRGVKAPVAGRVCMDYTVLDLSDIPDARVGDAVTVFGKDEDGSLLPVAEVAERGDTIAHELLCRISPRVEREYI